MYTTAVGLKWAGKQTHVIPTLGRRRCSTYIEFRRHLMFLAHGKTALEDGIEYSIPVAFFFG